jgi:hypothetical protein
MVMHSKKILANVLAALVASVALGLLVPELSAAAPKFKIHTEFPSSSEPNQIMTSYVQIENVGDEASKGPITLTLSPSAGLEAAAPAYISQSMRYPSPGSPTYSCEVTGSVLTCTIQTELPPNGQFSAYFTQIKVESGASGPLHLAIVVSGGGAAAPATVEEEILAGSRQPFALSHFGASIVDRMEEPLTQAAAVPTEMTTTVNLQSSLESWMNIPFFSFAFPIENAKDITVHLPTGFVGNPTAIPTCPAELLAEVHSATGSVISLCPDAAQIGVAYIGISSAWIIPTPVYNMVPPPGAATQLGFEIANTIVLLDAYVRPGDHGIDIVSRNTETTLPLLKSDIVVWGDPSSPRHDYLRGACLENHSGFASSGNNGLRCPSTLNTKKAFLRLPTSCSGKPLAFGAETNTWLKQETFVHASFDGPTLTGCDRVPFSPTIFTQPTATAADSPTGVAVQLSMPQNTNPEGLAEGDLKKAVVTLPEGMTLNPSSADGLKACGDAELKLDSNVPSSCPDASKVGTVVLKTPLLENSIEGFVWLRTQNSSDPMSGEMFRLAIELRDDRHGIDIKVPGQVQANPVTGRLTSTFDDAPQLPFQDMTLHFKSGARAPLTTPFSCQPQTTEADMYPWARPDVPVHTDMTFSLTSGPEGLPCQAARPFNPGFNAGVGSVQAGGFTPFLATFSRKDVDQSMQRVSVRMPKGLLGSLIGLPLCGEAQANAGTCDKASEIGSVTAGAGDGPTPFYVTGGHVYMTQGYEGAPFGLSVVVPAKAGPFDLGQVVVRAKVEVDIHTAQLTVTTDPLPQIVGGVPVNLRLVNVTINRPDFTYNPTNCDPSEVSGTMTGGQGAVASLSNHFQVTNCGALSFKPKFSVSTTGKTSRKTGAGLTAKLLYPRGPQGTQANIAKVKVSLPKQLPSRLTTLQKACDAATFDTNPAACPAASRIGIAKANTPVLPVELTGPVYFVSHGGEAFPDLVVVLQGYGVTVNLVGTTFISKAGITSTTFKEVPDVPVGSFELKLPQGPNSALAANGNLCASKLVMPTIFLAQDGEEIKTNTKITATGCAKHKTHKKHKKHHKHKGKKK